MAFSTPILSQLADWQIGILAVLIFFVYALALCLPSIRRFARTHVMTVAGGLPGVGSVTTLIGLLLVVVAMLSAPATASLGSSKGIWPFLAGAIICLFIYFPVSRYVQGWTVYCSEALFSSAWYMLAWAVFGVVDSLLPTVRWTLVMLLAPLALLADTIASIYLRSIIAGRENKWPV